jgi:hypothetical protein
VKKTPASPPIIPPRALVKYERGPGWKKTSTSSPGILPAADFIRSLIRSKAYLDDYNAHAVSLAKWEIADSTWNGKDQAAIQERYKLTQKDIDQEALEEGKKFLQRWPALRHPIPPYRAMNNPDNFLLNLRSPVEILRDPSDERPLTGKKWGLRLLTMGGPRSSDLRDGQFLHVKIDATRPKEEILKALGSELDWRKYTDERLPFMKARTSKPKKSKLDLSSRRWEVWDIHVGKAKRIIRKTATFLFPREYSPKIIRAEVEAGAENFLEAKGGRRGLRGRDFTRHELLLRAPATKERTAKWKNIEKEVRRVIKSCEAYIAAHKPVETQV